MLRFIKNNLFLLLVFGSLTVMAQAEPYFIGKGLSKLHKLEEKATDAFNSRNYYGAYDLYRKALKIDSTKVDNQYQLAKSAENYGAYCIAADAYDKVIEMDTIDTQFPEALNRFAMMQEKREQISSADKMLYEIDQRVYAETNPAIESEYLPKKLEFINTGFAEMNPVWRDGQLYYGSLAFTKKKNASETKDWYAKSLKSNLNTDPTPSEFNIEEKFIAHLSFTPKDDRVYFTICDYNEYSEIICQLYYRNKKAGTTNEWDTLVQLPPNVNHQGFTNTQPSVGIGPSGGDVLYYVTNRLTVPDKPPVMNIWYTEIIDAINFSEPILLGGPINTTSNEISPFYHFESQTLYFSSNKPSGNGGYDIYKVKNKLNKGWTNLENMDFPTNSGEDDYNYFLKKKEDKAFYVTNREGCDTEIDSVGCYDIYEIKIKPCTTDAQILLVDLDTKDSLNFETLAINEEGISNTPSVSTTSVIYKDIEEGSYSVIASAVGYFPKDTTISILACEENTFVIPICAPTLNIKVFGSAKQGEKGSYAQNSTEPKQLNNYQIKMIPLGQPDAEPLTIQANQNFEITTKVLPNTSYWISASHEDYAADTILSTSILSCKNSVELLLPLPALPEIVDSAIVCYFEHDKPDRFRYPNKKVILSKDTLSEYSFSLFYPDYNTLGEFYSQEFIKNKRGNQRLTDSLNVQDFFNNKVIRNNTRLVNFRESLYQILSAEPNSKYTLEIVGYCSSTGSDVYNNKLAKRRVDCVRQFFLEEFEGKQIATNQLAFKKIYKGEKDFTARYPDTDRTNSVYNPFSSDQRRVEVAGYTKGQIISGTLGANGSRE